MQTCTAAFATKDRLRTHMVRHEGKVSCNICGKLLSAAYITSHLKTHGQSQSINCNTCKQGISKSRWCFRLFCISYWWKSRVFSIYKDNCDCAVRTVLIFLSFSPITKIALERAHWCWNSALNAYTQTTVYTFHSYLSTTNYTTEQNFLQLFSVWLFEAW